MPRLSSDRSRQHRWFPARPLLSAVIALLLTPAVPAATATAQSPLVNRLWSTTQQRFITWPEFYTHWLPKGGWLLIGEQHDDPTHHHIEADLIRAMGQRGILGNVALEMATVEQQPALNRARRHPQQVTAAELNWSKGWDWSLYRAPVQVALRYAQRVLGADLTRQQITQAYREKAPLGELEPAHSAFMRELLYTSHCKQLPRSQLDPMRQVQLARDQHMAQVLKTGHIPDRTGVLLTGAIHARADLGIPRWSGTLPVTTLLLQSVDERSAPQAYLPQSFGNLKRTDLILFTPSHTQPDYCRQFSADNKK